MSEVNLYSTAVYVALIASVGLGVIALNFVGGNEGDGEDRQLQDEKCVAVS